jgi:uncharacterized protein (DUF3084 family)
MELKSKKKAEAFSNEITVLTNARQTLEASGVSEQDLRTAYTTLCDEYEKLLDEAKFLTKVSDKLESKLNASLEKLKTFNAELTTEAEVAKNQKEKVMEKNKQLYQEKSELDFRMNRFQLILIVLIVILFVVLLIMAYWLFIKPRLH